MMEPADDDLAEIDTTPEEFARYKAESVPVRPASGRPRGVGIRLAEAQLTFQGTTARRGLRLDGNKVRA